MGFNMCLGIFTLYKNTGKEDHKINSATEEFNFTDFESRIINSTLMFGVLIGNSIVGTLSDKYGRKPVTGILAPLCVLVAVLSTFLTFDFISYAFWRFLTGAFTGGLGVAVSVLTLELVGNEYWGKMCIMGSVFFAIGLFILSELAKIFNYWKSLTLATALPNIYLLYIIYITPESPRWLASQGKYDQAENILKMIGRGNNKSEIDLRKVCLKRENQTPRESPNQNQNRKVSEGGLDILKSKIVRTRMLVMVVVWYSVSLIYYGLTLGAGDLGDNIYENTIFSGLSELPGYVITIMMMENKVFGRKKSLIIFYFLIFLMCAIIDIFALQGHSKLILALMSKMLIAGAFAACYTYACELFPTTIRSIGLGWSSMAARIGGISAPFAISLGHMIRKDDDNSGFLFYGIFSLISGFVLFLVPETYGKELFDNIKELERSVKNERDDLFESNIEVRTLLMNGDSDED